MVILRLLSKCHSALLAGRNPDVENTVYMPQKRIPIVIGVDTYVFPLRDYYMYELHVVEGTVIGLWAVASPGQGLVPIPLPQKMTVLPYVPNDIWGSKNYAEAYPLYFDMETRINCQFIS